MVFGNGDRRTKNQYGGYIQATFDGMNDPASVNFTVALSDAQKRGEEGLTFTVVTAEGGWDWMKLRQDGGVEADNLIGTFA